MGIPPSRFVRWAAAVALVGATVACVTPGRFGNGAAGVAVAPGTCCIHGMHATADPLQFPAATYAPAYGQAGGATPGAAYGATGASGAPWLYGQAAAAPYGGFTYPAPGMMGGYAPSGGPVKEAQGFRAATTGAAVPWTGAAPCPHCAAGSSNPR